MIVCCLWFYTYSKKKHGDRRKNSLSKLEQMFWKSSIKCECPSLFSYIALVITIAIVQQNITRETVMNQSEGKTRNTHAALWAGKVT